MSLLLTLLNESFGKSAIQQIESNYLRDKKAVSKWMCFSDYCLDDNKRKNGEHKPNKVVTFSLMPYMMSPIYEIVEKRIKEVVKTDIKKTKTVTNEFIEFLKVNPIINFSFILNDRSKLFGNTHDEVQNNLKKNFEGLIEHYKSIVKKGQGRDLLIKKLEACVVLIDQNKKIKHLIDLLLVSFLGSYVSSIILNRVDKVEVFAWLSDRDKLFDIERGFICNLFNVQLKALLGGRNFKFGTSLADCHYKIFYDPFIRIPDHIAGSLADFDIEGDWVNHEKFNTVLTNYMADNQYNNYVFKISKRTDGFHCEEVTMMKKEN